jgi:hypothetical protein
MAASFLSGSVRIGANVTNFEAYLRALGYARQHYNGAIAALLGILFIPTILARALTEPFGVNPIAESSEWPKVGTGNAIRRNRGLRGSDNFSGRIFPPISGIQGPRRLRPNSPAFKNPQPFAS